MKTAYFDCFSGISGNMVLGALIDLGLDVDALREGLRSLPVEYSLEATRVTKQGIAGTYVEVITSTDEADRSLPDILGLIERSRLSHDIKEQSKAVFLRLGEAEARVHGLGSVDSVVLHEVGETDTIVDVVGSLIGLKMLEVDAVACSPLNLGKGLVSCHHGLLPVPAPITAELVKGFPVFAGDVEGELTTPTGAAIITGVAGSFGDMPPMRVQGVGYGAGKMDLSIPNLLRVFVGETAGSPEGDVIERVTVLETNIDDMNPQLYEHVMERLFEAGALDVFLTPVQMKKNRPGTLLSVVARSEAVSGLVDILLVESTTLGVRVSERIRYALSRSTRPIETSFGQVRVKVACRGDAVVKMVPEYEDCKRAARNSGVPIAQVYAEVQTRWREVCSPPGG